MSDGTYYEDDDRLLLNRLKNDLQSYYRSEALDDEETITLVEASFAFCKKQLNQGTKAKDLGARRVYELMEHERDTYYELYQAALKIIEKYERTDEITNFYTDCQVAEFAVRKPIRRFARLLF